MLVVEVRMAFFSQSRATSRVGSKRCVHWPCRSGRSSEALGGGEAQPGDESLDRDYSTPGPAVRRNRRCCHGCRGEPRHRSEFPKFFITGHVPPLIRTPPRSCAELLLEGGECCGVPSRPCRPCDGSRRRRCRRTASARRRRGWGESCYSWQMSETGTRSIRWRRQGWRPSRSRCSSCGAFASEKLLPSPTITRTWRFSISG